MARLKPSRSVLSTMTFAIGRRVIVVDGAERFKEAEVSEHIAPAMAAMPPDTTIAFFAREEGKTKAPAALHAAVKSAKGQIVCGGDDQALGACRLGARAGYAARTLAGCVRRQDTRRTGRRATAAAVAGAREAQALAEQSGDGPIKVSAEDIEQQSAHSTAYRAFTFADALVGGDAAEAMRSYLRLRTQGERLSGLVYLMAQRLRDAEGVSVRIQAGEAPAAIKRTLRMPPRAADRFIADVARTEPERLRAALCRIADLELDTRGGAPLSESRTSLSSLEEDTLAMRAILAVPPRRPLSGARLCPRSLVCEAHGARCVRASLAQRPSGSRI